MSSAKLWLPMSLISRWAAALMLVLTAATPVFAAATVVSWSQPNSIVYGTAISTPATATSQGQPVAGSFIYNPPLGTVLPVGRHSITATFTPAAGGSTTSRSINLRVTRATLNVTSTATKVYGAAVPTLTPTYSGLVNGDTAAAVLTGSPALTTSATSTSPVGSYAISVSRGSLSVNGNYTLTYTNGTLTVTKATATIALAGLNQTYTGAARMVSATTTPAGLATSVTYNGSTTAPINAGSYAVVATVTDANFQGTSSGTLVVAKASASVALGALSATYDGTTHAATVTTTPAGLPTTVTYDGSAALPLGAGSYAVVATIAHANYAGSASGTLVVTKAAATVALGDLLPIYDGTPKSATATTTPAGLATSITYNGSPVVPTNVGTYAVVATITDANHAGSANGTLTIGAAVATITLTDLAHTYDGAAHPATVVTTPAGLPVLVSYNSNSAAPVNAGSYEVIAAIQDPNYTGVASDFLVIGKATATVTLANLAYTYDGNPHQASATTTPAGLAVSLTYNGGAAAPVGAGNYLTVATVVDDNHVGAASDTLTIAQATQTISMAALSDVMVGDPDQALSATATSGLPVGFSVTGPAEIIGNALHVSGDGIITVTAAQAGDANWLAAAPVMQTITAIPETGGGLVGSYFANKTLSGSPVLTRVDPQVNFDWASGSPASGTIPTDNFSVRWDGEVVPRFNETYTLTFRTDDGVRVWFDSQLIVNSWNDRSAANSTFTFAAQAGRHYTIRMEYYENGGLAVAQMLWQSASEPFAVVPKRQLYPVAPVDTGMVGTGTGLTGSYFTNETVSGVPAVTRLDTTVDFDWVNGAPASGIGADYFSARWSGQIQPRYTEDYTLVLRTDDGVRMWLNGILVINDWFARSVANSSFTFAAQAGQRYDIRIEYYEHGGQAVAQLGWYSAHEYFGAVPTTQLYPLPPPTVVVADVTQTLAEGQPVTLTGIVTGLDTGALAWSQISGPAAATFHTPDQTTTQAHFPVAGTYVVALSAFNGHVVVSDTTTVTVAPGDLTSNLVAHYTFDETTGDRAFDSSGKHHTGILYGATRTSGKQGGALRFDGNTFVYVQGNEDLDPQTPALTLSAWLKPDRTLQQMTSTGPMLIYRADYATSVGYGLMVTALDSDRLGLRVHHLPGAGQRLETFTAQPLVPATWVHVAGVYSGTTMSIHLNGVQVASRTTNGSSIRAAGNLAMFLGRGFEGVIDDVRIYHRALTSTDLASLAQGGTNHQAPSADAGPDQVTALPNASVTLAGGVSGGTSTAGMQATWTQISGPATATFSDPHSLTPSVSFSAAGTYQFGLAISDGMMIGRDQVRVEVSPAAVNLTGGLLIHYKLDELTGNLVADSSASATAATFFGIPQWQPDQGALLGAAYLDGVSLIKAENPPQLSNLTRMTLSVWMHGDRALVDMAHPWPEPIYHADYATNRGFGLMLTTQDTNYFGFRLHTGTGMREVSVNGIAANTWVHVVATFDGQTMRLYRDRTLVGVNETGAIPLPGIDIPLLIGNGYEGMLDDVRIYDRALTPLEVDALHISSPLLGNG